MKQDKIAIYFLCSTNKCFTKFKYLVNM